jgi:hypothetical protein
MTYASVRSAAEHIARTGAITPHQLAALTRLDERLKAHPDIAQEFTDGWRTEGSPAVKAPTMGTNSWEGVYAAAQAIGTRYPELVAAQWALESAHGKAPSGRNNYWGLKGSGTSKPTWEVVNGQTVDIVASFLDFDSIAAGVDHLVSRWYKDFKGYKGVDRAASREDAARQMVAQGYATDPSYAQKLIVLMDQHAPRPKVATPVQQPVRSHSNPLQVPWYAQMDSADRAQAARMCFSSSCAMLLQYLKPGTLSGGNGDDQYLARVQRYGDTTDATAQVRALASFGIKARFVQSAGWADIERQIATGIPVPCGFLHRGPVTAPGGGGHWLIVVGFTPTQLIVHDPFGEADLVNGTTLGGAARFARYSYKNFGPRWMVEGPGTGWAVLADR